MKIVDIKQRTPEWHRWRNTGVSASEAAILMKRSEYKTVWRLWAEKKGLVLPDNLDANPNVQRGVRLEPKARKAFEKRHDAMLLAFCAESEQYPFMRASFDGVTDDGVPVELKAPTEDNYWDARHNGTGSTLYATYFPQVQQQILVSGSDHGYLSLYLHDNETYDFLINRDDAFIQDLISASKAFVACLQSGKEPDKDPERDIYIPSGLELEEWKRLAAEYRVISATLDGYETQMHKLKRETAAIQHKLLALMADFTQAECAGLRINRYLAQGAVDYKEAITSLFSEFDAAQLEAFRKEGSERVRVTLKDEEGAIVPFSIEELCGLSGPESFYFG